MHSDQLLWPRSFQRTLFHLELCPAEAFVSDDWVRVICPFFISRRVCVHILMDRHSRLIFANLYRGHLVDCPSKWSHKLAIVKFAAFWFLASCEATSRRYRPLWEPWVARDGPLSENVFALINDDHPLTVIITLSGLFWEQRRLLLVLPMGGFRSLDELESVFISLDWRRQTCLVDFWGDVPTTTGAVVAAIQVDPTCLLVLDRGQALVMACKGVTARGLLLISESAETLRAALLCGRVLPVLITQFYDAVVTLFVFS